MLETFDELFERFNRSVDECLHELLDIRGWSIEKLANATGVSRDTLTNWKSSSSRDPRVSFAIKLHLLLGRSFELIGAQAPEPKLSRGEILAMIDQQLDLRLRRGLRLGIVEDERVSRDWELQAGEEEGSVPIESQLEKLNQRKTIRGTKKRA